MGMFEVFVMYSNSVRSFSTVRVKYFVTVATYGVITHLVKPVLKENRPLIITYPFHVQHILIILKFKNEVTGTKKGI